MIKKKLESFLFKIFLKFIIEEQSTKMSLEKVLHASGFLFFSFCGSGVHQGWSPCPLREVIDIQPAKLGPSCKSLVDGTSDTK